MSGLIVGIFLGIGAAVIFSNKIKLGITGAGSPQIAKGFAVHPTQHITNWGGGARFGAGSRY